MDWFNENAGVMVLLLTVVSIAAFVFLIVVLTDLKGRIAVQRLKMVGFYSKEVGSRENYAEFTVGNRSLNDVGVKEIGLQNGKICYDLTPLYMQKANINAGTRIVIDQRSSITFRMTEEELSCVLLETPRGKRLSRLRLYVVDLPGNVYYGNMRAVRKLLSEYMKGLAPSSPAPEGVSPEAPEKAEEPSASVPVPEREGETEEV